MQFQPPDNGNGGLWFADKLGEWVASNDIVPGGSQHLQGVMEKGLRYNASDGKHSMTIGSLDAGLANFGALTAYPSPVNASADTKSFGSSFVLFDNLCKPSCTLLLIVSQGKAMPTRSNTRLG